MRSQSAHSVHPLAEEIPEEFCKRITGKMGTGFRVRAQRTDVASVSSLSYLSHYRKQCVCTDSLKKFLYYTSPPELVCSVPYSRTVVEMSSQSK
jgi:hypothetical protein